MPSRNVPVPTTPFPSHLLDEVMPTLTDTQWRLLCVIVRATLGWQGAGEGERKQQDWLTHGQLKARTGRSSEAVCRSLDALVQRGLVEVCNEAGILLSTPQQRRGCLGKLFFGLGAAAVPTTSVGGADYAGAAEVPFTDEEGIPKSEKAFSESEIGAMSIEITKAKTTKETEDKRTPEGVKGSEPAPVEKSGENSPVASQRSPHAKATAADPDVKRFLMAYQELFARQSAHGEPPPMSWGRDGKLVKGLLAQYGYERLRELLARFFQSEDAWVKKRGYALACFPTLLPTLLMSDGIHAPEMKSEAIRRAAATPVVKYTPAGQQWQQAGDIAVSEKSLFERYPELKRKVRGQPP